MARPELDAAFRAGRINGDTKVLRSGAKEWVAYRTL
jgi:hypothetical protein